MDKKNKILIGISIITIIFMSVLLGGYIADQKRQLKVLKLYKNTELGKSKSDIEYKIDSINVSDTLCNIKGWALIKGVNSYNVIPQVILKDAKGNLYKIKTRICERKDITKQYNGSSADENTHLTCVTKSDLGVTKDKYVYDNCGINSEFDIKDLKKNEKYEIGIQLELNKADYLVWTSNKVKL